MSGLVALITIDILVVAGVSIGVGAIAPRWPSRWLSRDRVPLALMGWETPAAYRRIGVSRLARILPELGSAFGGQSKSALPGLSAADLELYLRELRRAEWVHWVSTASPLVLFLFNPWWLALVFLVVVALGNLPFILVLRNNRRRTRAIIARNENRT